MAALDHERQDRGATQAVRLTALRPVSWHAGLPKTGVTYELALSSAFFSGRLTGNASHSWICGGALSVSARLEGRS